MVGVASNTAPSYLHKVEQTTVKKVHAQEVPPAPPVAPVVERPQPIVYPVSGNRAIGQEMAIARGWGGDQWVCLERLWTNESGWNHQAHNRSSGAHGIPQALPASKMASHGADYYTNPRVQIAWGLDYIAGRYGSPCSALSFWNSKSPHWY